MDMVTQVGIAPNIGIRSYVTVLAYVDISFNVYACPDDTAFV